MFIVGGLVLLAFGVAIGRCGRPATDPRNDHWRNNRRPS